MAEIDYTELDPECVSLVRAMNVFPGIQTFESCCGHGKNPFCVWFTAESLEVLPALLYWFQRCQSCSPSGVGGWQVKVSTDCSQHPACFLAESGSVGKDAHAEAEIIAMEMLNGHAHNA